MLVVGKQSGCLHLGQLWLGVPRELGKSAVPPAETAVLVEHVEDIFQRVKHSRSKPLLSASPLGFLSCVDSVVDPVSQQFILFGSLVLLKIVGNPGSNCVAGNGFAALTSKKNKWEVRILFADSLQECEPVHAGHVVIGDDTVRHAVINAL